MDDGANSVSSSNSPSKVNNGRRWYEVRLDGEKMSDLVDGKPDCRQRASPKEEEGKEVHGVCAR